MRHFIQIVENAQFKDRKTVALKDGRQITIDSLESFDDGLHCLEVFAELDGELVGEGKYDMETGQFRGVEVPGPYRRLGIATAIYDYVEGLGHDVSPSPHLQSDGVQFWNARNRRDVVENASAAELVARLNAMNLPAIVKLNVLDDHTVEITDIRTDHHGIGKGNGRSAMTTIIGLADELGVTLEAWPMWDEDVEGALPPEELERWYGRLGFKTIANRDPDSDMEIDRYLVRRPV